MDVVLPFRRGSFFICVLRYGRACTILGGARSLRQSLVSREVLPLVMQDCSHLVFFFFVGNHISSFVSQRKVLIEA